MAFYLRITPFFLLLALIHFAARPPKSLAQPTDEGKSPLASLRDEIWEWELKNDPWLATEVGAAFNQDRFGDDTFKAIKLRNQSRVDFAAKLAAIDRQKLDQSDRIDAEIIRLRLQDSISDFENQMYLMPISGRSGFHLSVAELPTAMRLESLKDYENYLARLADFPRYAAEQTELMRQGLKLGFTPPSIVLKDLPTQIESQIVEQADQSELYKPFANSRPANISASQWQELQQHAKQVIEQSIVPAYQRILEFATNEYLPGARDSIAARALPNGQAFYRQQVRHHTTLELDPQEIHQIGLSEVARIRAEMQTLMSQQNFSGSLADFTKALQNDPAQFASSEEELMQFVALILKRIDGKLPEIFSVLPRTPYGLKAIPDFIAPQTSSAYYWPPAGDGSRAGTFYLNTYNLSQRPKFEMTALALHESVPGHHLQIALAQEMPTVHPLRRFTMFTAFVEGWGLYAETLGQDLNMYEDPYQDFGRLSFEAWRACRLVVDTGIHELGWTRQQAVNYMRENTALSDHNIVSEVDRYIGWPGQALAYKLGQLKITELRKQAEQELGETFELRAFHRVVLGNGAVPLSILENQVNAWINSAARLSESSTLQID